MQARGMWSADQSDDQERFLADLRALRDTAALGHDELAARAHYPSDILKEAENGPSLPGLPILAAYVRACDGDVPEWEERWRCLGYESRVDHGLPVRPAGTSPAAVAGARAGVSIVPPDMYDPERIRAALRGQQVGQTAQAGPGRTAPDAVGAGTPTARAPESPAGWGENARWDTNGGTGTTAGTDTSAGWGTNTSRDAGSVWSAGTSWDAGSAWGTGASRDAATDSSTAPANGNHHAGPQGGAGLFDPPVARTPGYPADPRGIRHDPFAASWPLNSELTAPTPEVGSGREESGPASAARTDFWASPAATTAPAARGPALSQAEEQPVSPEPNLPQGAGSAASAQAQGKPAAQQTTAAPPSQPRRDRLFPLRLLAVIVVAALIGSILVLLIR